MAISEKELINQEALQMHRRNHGKLSVVSKVQVRDLTDLSRAYSPGVAEPCRRIHENPEEVYTYTIKGNLVAVVSDGTAVLGLGDIGPEAAMPVMEGKALLFKSFGGVDAFPVCVATKDPEEIIKMVKYLEPTFGGVNLEDISAPRCFEIERRLKAETSIPIFHDDQHGTAIVTAAGLINAARVVGKRLENMVVVVNGAGASGMAVSKLLMKLGVRDLTLCDTKGAIYEGRPEGMNPYKDEIAQVTNRAMNKGKLADVMKGADVFVGLSQANQVTPEMVQSMARDPIIFAMANPTPEIMPEDALAAGARVVGTGRSDYPNQVNNVLAFPGVFRGALDTRASDINEEMKVAAAQAIASLVSPAELGAEYVIPQTFDRRVAPAVAAAVAQAAIDTGVARMPIPPEEVAEHCRRLVEQVMR